MIYMQALLNLLFAISDPVLPAVAAEGAYASMQTVAVNTLVTLCAACNGTKRIPTGDGQSTTKCDCDDCKCKKTASVLVKPAAKPVTKPAATPNCANGKCQKPVQARRR